MTISPGYFEVFKIPVKRGRTFNERDTSTSTPVVVINEAMAKQYWPKGDPLTDRLVIGKGVMREFASKASGRSSASSPTSRATASTASRSRRCSSRRRRCRTRPTR